MKILFIILFVVWVVGYIRQLAEISAVMEKVGFRYPSKEVRVMMPIVLFFTWPYFYFYEKAL